MNETFIPMYVDIVFKKIWGDPNNIERLTFLLSTILKIPYEELVGNVEIIESEKRINNKKDKRQRNDITAKISFPKKTKVNLEMNTGSFSKALIDRNTSYIVHIFSSGIKNRQSYNDIMPVIQINFNTFSVNPDKIIDIFYLQDDVGYKLTEKLLIYTIDIEKCKNICYTENIKNFNKEEQEIIKLGALMMESKKDEFNKCLGEIDMNNKMRKDINETMEDLSSDEEMLNYFDYEQDEIALRNGYIDEAREDGFNQGIKEEKLVIAKKMLEKNIDLNTISEITGITKEELEKLN